MIIVLISDLTDTLIVHHSILNLTDTVVVHQSKLALTDTGGTISYVFVCFSF